MLSYYVWALAEKTLSHLPFGKSIYAGVGSLVNKHSKGRSSSFRSSFRLTRKGRTLIPPGGTVLEVGSGWFHHDAFLLYIVGDYKIYLFDVEDKAKLLFKNYLDHLLQNIDLVASELCIDRSNVRSKLEKLLDMDSREDIYAALNASCVPRHVHPNRLGRVVNINEYISCRKFRGCTKVMNNSRFSQVMS